jgi:hypothetical protein
MERQSEERAVFKSLAVFKSAALLLNAVGSGAQQEGAEVLKKVVTSD